MDDIKIENPFIKSRTNISGKREMRVMLDGLFGLIAFLTVIWLLKNGLPSVANINFEKSESFFRQRKVYKNYYYEVRGKVISFREYVDSNGINNQTYYSIDVKVRKGKTYHITTLNKDARKYRKKVYITLLVPRDDADIIKDKENAVVIKEDNMKKRECIIALIIGWAAVIIYAYIFSGK
jgi:hypothetical protein